MNLVVRLDRSSALPHDDFIDDHEVLIYEYIYSDMNVLKSTDMCVTLAKMFLGQTKYRNRFWN